MESVNCESETLRKFDEKREVFWQPGHGPARPGEIGRAHRAARHGKTARGLCLGPEARHGMAGTVARVGTARPAGPRWHDPMDIYSGRTWHACIRERSDYWRSHLKTRA